MTGIYSYSFGIAVFLVPLRAEVWGQLPTSPCNHGNESDRLKELGQDRGCLQPGLHKKEKFRVGQLERYLLSFF